MRHVESYHGDQRHRYTVYSNPGRDELLLVVYVEGQRVVVNVHIKKDDARALGQALLDEVAEPTGDDDEVDILDGDDEGIDIDFPFDADAYRDGAL